MRLRAAALVAALLTVLTAPVTSAQTGCRPPSPQVSHTTPWAQQLLRPERVWELTRGDGVVVAVLDSGVDARTPQLAGSVLPGVDVITPGGGTADTDCYGHGTFVAGIIAAQPMPGIGFAGVAPGARILPVRDAWGSDDGSAATMARGIRVAVDSGARVINISASTDYPDEGLRAAVDYAKARDVLIVAAAANDAQQGNPTTYPASYPGVLAVGAIDASGRRADFSQTGPFLGLVAPGVDVQSIGPGGPGHWQGDGTSYATPFVAGTAALVRAYHPELTAQQVLDRLLRTAIHPGVSVPDPELGWGTVNPYGAVTAVLPTEHTVGASVAQRVSHPEVPEPNPVPRRVVLVSITSAILLVCLAALAAYLGPAAWRRSRTRDS
ncbi:peptidase S8 [Saccharopolyspora subtropica]|uniref:Peptidase S8 n=1 Tax=Saccharopolyspora thermophila TaxID=89367 RepID=A0A917JKF1_9PSEU|nr:type VII secretion-associated serine protease mycosin [Saccharopolyspora subtropica]GGI69242.1 peptidase S8 [Saccharopolyspora subtropica]